MKISKQDAKTALLWLGIWTAALTVAFLIPIDGDAQTDTTLLDCHAVVTTDDAGVIHDSSAINQAAGKLMDQGVDVHVITLGPLHPGETLRQAALLTAGYCDWMINNRTVYKPNLLLFVVAPKDRKKNAFFGQAIAPALENAGAVDFLYSQSANPYFKTGDFAGGLAAAERDFSSKIAAYHDQAKHPKQTVVNNQATDYSGLWTVFQWTLAAVVIGFIIFFIVILLRRRKEDEDEVKAAKGDAIDARNRATDAYDALSDSAQSSFAKYFSNLSNTVANDPTVDGLTVAEYKRIERAWDGFYDAATGNEYPPVRPTNSGPLPEHLRDDIPAQSTSPRYKDWSKPAPSVVNTTTVIHEHDSSDGFVTGLVVGDILSDREPRREREDYAPSYSTPAPSFNSGDDSSYSTSSTSSDDDNSGDDSSFSDSSGGSDFSSGDDSGF